MEGKEMPRRWWMKGVVVGIIALFIGAGVMANIIPTVDAARKNTSVLSHKTLLKNIKLGSIYVWSDGHQETCVIEAEKEAPSQLSVDPSGEEINFFVDIYTSTSGTSDLGTAIVSINDEATSKSDDHSMDELWNYTIFCKRGTIITYSITAMLTDLNFDPQEQSETKVGSVACQKSMNLFTKLYEMRMRFFTRLFNFLQSHKTLMHGSIQVL